MGINQESMVELSAIDFIKNNLNYEFIEGEFLTPEFGERESLKDSILKWRLKKALKRINPWMNDENMNKTVADILDSSNSGESLIEVNKRVNDFIVNSGYGLQQDLGGSDHKKYNMVKFIDWDNIDNNQFLVTNNFRVQGLNGIIIGDIVIFVNGIPIVVLECNSSERYNPGSIQNTYKQLKKYMIESKELFCTNFFTGIFDEKSLYVGTITSECNEYMQWIYEDTDNSKRDDNTLQVIFEKNNLLDIIKNFIFYEGHSNRKFISRYHQFNAVNKTVDKLINGKDSKDKGGLICHPQGTGKYLTMSLLTKKIKTNKNFINSKIIIVVDRVDLCQQIYHGFMNSSNMMRVVMPKTSDELKYFILRLNFEIIITTIQKFNNREEVLVPNKDSNIIVLVDNANRSQMGNLAMSMRKTLSNAVYIGFTDIPNDKAKVMFGDYIDIYSIENVINNGKVQVLYEGRKVMVNENSDIFYKEIDELGLMDKEFDRVKNFIENEERIDTIAQDILQHYKENIFPNGFKAQLVCSSRNACIKYYEALNKYVNEIIGKPLEIKVIISSNLNDPPEFEKYYTNKNQQQEFIHRFKMPIEQDKLSIIIVNDMLLTDFDALIQQCVYIDKPLKGQRLIQTIARISRPYGNKKECAYIVDYYGIERLVQETMKTVSK
ncbi:type I restriction endonuclease subunit R [Clostridium sp. ZS2-4]|uniref:type I restriction endonuclease subunit R n=1 Tax=Clostridium sp. ZS2-4 TaxID=2987703 RepID=UPI002279FAFC|nr:HsdR family type I site-specific deoxyribonuclease [Clostridium sp. ZS2-4]MCY6355374.1 HsdR family type I site-specific deoxyribonuclease [Clostridium sp. ZS2-4]